MSTYMYLFEKKNICRVIITHDCVYSVPCVSDCLCTFNPTINKWCVELYFNSRCFLKKWSSGKDSILHYMFFTIVYVVFTCIGHFMFKTEQIILGFKISLSKVHWINQ